MHALYEGRGLLRVRWTVGVITPESAVCLGSVLAAAHLDQRPDFTTAEGSRNLISTSRLHINYTRVRSLLFCRYYPGLPQYPAMSLEGVVARHLHNIQ